MTNILIPNPLGKSAPRPRKAVPPPAHIPFPVRPELLTLDHLDSKIAEAVFSINASGWVWTVWSCEGHDHGEGCKTIPYLGLVVQTNRVGELLEILYEAALEIRQEIEIPADMEGILQRERCIEFTVRPDLEMMIDPSYHGFCLYVPNGPLENAQAYFRLVAERIYGARV